MSSTRWRRSSAHLARRGRRLVEGFFTPSSTDAHNREIIISDYDEEPEMLESDIRQA